MAFSQAQGQGGLCRSILRMRTIDGLSSLDGSWLRVRRDHNLEKTMARFDKRGNPISFGGQQAIDALDHAIDLLHAY
jgi:hypothetical protein